MFEIDDRNKVILTKGDLASFDCTITDSSGEVRVPEEGDSLVFSLDGTDFSKTATITDNKYVFTINGTDLADVNEGVYFYRVVLNNKYTVIQECFFDLLSGGNENEG